jgi:2-polyprenyl-3-methyl-5-hydroxy-6-metoxy-1,4-benzoquinol methylase
VNSTNYEKFRTRNPLVRHLIDSFYDKVLGAVEPIAPTTLLDAGCGEGETLSRLGDSLPSRVVAIDIDSDAVAFTAERIPSAEVSRGSVVDLPFADDSFDLVVCLEVLEHLPDPNAALAELERVSAGHVVISVPREPWFRLGSLLRGNYLRTLGNHPEHVNHWNRRSLRAFLEPQLEVVSLRGSFPWLIAVCRLPRR